MSALHTEDEALAPRERLALNLYLITALVVLVLMMVFGLLMRLAQSAWLNLDPSFFYQLMTAHGAGMVGVAGLGSSAVMWFFLRKYVRLSTGIFLANFVLFLIGAVLILGSTFVGKYAGGWTFLYPLPVKSMGAWSVHAGAAFMLGYLFIGVGFLLFYLDVIRALIGKYGNLGRSLGVHWLFAGEVDKSHPVTVVASTMVAIINTLSVLAGAVVLVMCIVNAYVPSFAPDPLLVKNLIYFFGHVFINASIYMAVIAVYELLPRYTGRPWTLSRPLVWAWVASTVMVLSVYPHHLLMDFAMPRWAAVIGQVLSYASGLPVFTVTVLGALANVYGSGMRWSMPSKLLMLSMFGWASGVVPAIIDATIRVNNVMHNTTWVPGHFHFYLLLGVLPMQLGFMYHLIGRDPSAAEPAGDRHGFLGYLMGGVVFVMMFLAGGHASTPRRWAAHLPEWMPFDRVAAIAAVVVILAMITFTVRIARALLEGARAAAHGAH